MEENYTNISDNDSTQGLYFFLLSIYFVTKMLTILFCKLDVDDVFYELTNDDDDTGFSNKFIKDNNKVIEIFKVSM